MDAEVRRAIQARLGVAIDAARRLGGGDINDAFALELADGRRVFAKCNARSPRDMFPAEARGLRWLAQARALAVPEVIAVSEPGQPAFLVLEFVDPGARVRDFEERLGRGLAALHRSGAPSFGLEHDNFIGSLPQSNEPAGDWPSFYAERRLLPLVGKALEGGRLSPATARRFDRLVARLPDLAGASEPPARLHGDLWGGNLHATDTGEPALIDPAVYGGSREIDLAMMRLFGGFGARVFDAYAEAYPLAAGHAERVPLYQLYPLLVHVNLFGGGYARSVEDALLHYV
jgi:fructosamine-3-kinase